MTSQLYNSPLKFNTKLEMSKPGCMSSRPPGSKMNVTVVKRSRKKPSINWLWKDKPVHGNLGNSFRRKRFLMVISMFMKKCISELQRVFHFDNKNINHKGQFASVLMLTQISGPLHTGLNIIMTSWAPDKISHLCQLYQNYLQTRKKNNA